MTLIACAYLVGVLRTSMLGLRPAVDDVNKRMCGSKVQLGLVAVALSEGLVVVRSMCFIQYCTHFQMPQAIALHCDSEV